MAFKVVQVLNHFLPHKTAGTEVYVWALARGLQHLQDALDSVKVVIPHYGQNAPALYMIDGIQVHMFAEPSEVDRSLIMGKRQPDGLVAFKTLLENEKPDIVHFHELAGSNGITLHHVIAAKQAGAKTIMTFHLAGNTCITGTMLYKEKRKCQGVIDYKNCTGCYLHSKTTPLAAAVLAPVSRMLLRFGIDATEWGNAAGTALGTTQLIATKKQRFLQLVAACDQLVVLTKWYKEVLLKNGVAPSKITHIPQALPADIQATKTLPKLENNTGIRLIFAGRISPFKGLHLLVEAVKDLPDAAVTLDIYGQPDETTYAADLMKATSTVTHIHWKGTVPPGQLVQVMASYDALCLCSTFSEMAPLVIQEAFAAGLPVIASDVAGNAEMITDGVNGLLFPFKNAAALKEILQRCMADKNLLPRLKQGVKPSASFNEVVQSYNTLYRRLLLV